MLVRLGMTWRATMTVAARLALAGVFAAGGDARAQGSPAAQGAAEEPPAQTADPTTLPAPAEAPTEAPGTAATPAGQPAEAAPDAPAGSSTAPAQVDVTAPPALSAAPEQAEPELIDTPVEPGSSYDLLPLTPPGQGGLTADQVATLSVKTSSAGRKAAAEARIAKVRADRAWSVYVPRVNLTARYTRLSDIDVDGNAFIPDGALPPGAEPPEFNIYFPDNFLLQASIRVPVSEYFLTLSQRYDAAQTLEQVGALQKRGEYQAIAHNSVVNYYTLARAVAARQLSEHRVAQLRQFVDEIRVLVEGGELSQVQLAQARARLAGAEAMAKRDEANQRAMEMVLRVEVGVDLEAPIGVAEPLTETRPTPPTDLEQHLVVADRERPELNALRELVKAQRQNRDAASGARFPQISLFASTDYANPNQRFFPLEQKFNLTWAAGVELTWSPTELAVRETELDEAEIEIVKVQMDLESLRARIVTEVTNAYEQAVAAAAAVESSQIAVEAAEESYRVSLALFHGGEATSRDVLDAEVELREAQLAWLDNVLNTHLAHVDLQHATGQLRY